MKQFFLHSLALLSCVCCLSYGAAAQHVDWYQQPLNPIPLGGQASATSVRSDAAGNIYVTGDFGGGFDADPGPDSLTLSAPTLPNAFIGKYTSAGQLIYAYNVGGTGQVQPKAMAIDDTGNVYITGTFGLSADFDPGPGIHVLTTANEMQTDIFVAKYGPSGNLKFAFAINSIYDVYNEGYSIDVDDNGNVFVAGRYSGDADFDPGPAVFSLPSAGMFFAKYSANATLQFANVLGFENYTLSDRALVLDNAGNVLIAGSFSGTEDFDFGPGSAPLTANNTDGFFAKYNNNGDYIIARAIGGADDDLASTIATDAANNIYVAGNFSDVVDFNPSPFINALTAVGSSDMFIAKYNASGNYIFAKGISGSYDNQRPASIVVDAAANIMIAGTFAGTVDFNPGAAVANTTSNGSTADGFVAKYDASGNYLVAFATGTSTENDYAYSIDTLQNGGLVTSGTFLGTSDFDPGPGVSPLTTGGFNNSSTFFNNGFFASYTAAGNLAWAGLLGRYNTGETGIAFNKIETDSAGNVYVAGSFGGVLDFDKGPGTYYLTAANGGDIFFAKYTSAGQLVWAKSFGGASEERVYDIDVDINGNLIIVGSFFGTVVDFEPGPGVTNLVSSSQFGTPFVAKYDNSGNYVYAQLPYAGVNTVATDALGNAYLAGDNGMFQKLSPAGSSLFSFSSINIIGQSISVRGNRVIILGNFAGTADFDYSAASTSFTSGNATSNSYITTYDLSGNHLYTIPVKGAGTVQSMELDLDTAGNRYIAGRMTGTADFDPGPGTAAPPSFGYYDIFVAKYDSSGNYIYVNRLGSSDFQEAIALAVDDTGNTYIAGNFQVGFDADPGTGVAMLANNSTISKAFYAKYSPLGAYKYAFAAGSDFHIYNDGASAVATDNMGAAYFSGTFTDTAFFYPAPSSAPVLVQQNTGGMAYLLKIINGLPLVSITASDTSICSNATVLLTATVSNMNAPSYQWRKNMNAIPGATLSTYTASNILDGDVFDVVVTAVTNSTYTSPSITISHDTVAVWTGFAGDNLWSNALNWSCGTVPTATNNVAIPAGAAVTISTPAAVCNNLTVEVGAAISFSGSMPELHVVGQMANNGVINTAGGTLQVEAP